MFLRLHALGAHQLVYTYPHEMSPAEVQEMKERFHLDKPVPVQYFYWIKGVSQGDLGWSGVASAPVVDVFPKKFAATMELAIAAGIVAVSLGIAMGTFAGARRNKISDHIIRVVSVSGASMPLFGLPSYC